MLVIPNTGERILLDKETPFLIARHLCVYKFAKDYVNDKSVLDVGCGEAYGSFYLANFAKEVVGVDYDKVIIDYAKSKYHKDNLRLCVVDAKDLDSLGDKFDVITAFQFIEHIQDTKTILLNIKSLLKDNGIFICSTPNRKFESPGSNIPLNKFHAKEYLQYEFKELLKTYFKKVNMFGVKRGRKLNCYRRLKKIGLFNLLPPSLDPIKKFYSRIESKHFIIVKDNLDTAVDFIALCKNFS